MEMLRESGFCHGIENYSCHLSGNPLGTRPSSLLDYFNRENKDFLMIADESHISIPQIGGMYEGDRSRKQTLVDFGFRLPSALDNRPLKFPEFEGLVKKMMMVSATPGKYDLKKAGDNVVELIIRPTGLIDPEVILRPIDGQIDDLMQEIKKTVAKSQRILVTTLTKKTAEDLTSFLKEKGFRVEYLHSEIDTLTRIEILKNLRLGEFDVLVGINLLREGLDLPEVALVAVLDADKEGFLRSEPTLIQICGRAARNVDGKVIFYADTMTGSMQRALNEMNRRRQKQIAYNVENNIKPRSIVKAVAELDEFQNLSRKQGVREVACDIEEYKVTPANIDAKIADLQKQMKQAGETLDFETAIVLRDKIKELQSLKSAVPISKVRKNKKVF
jgi:excinuclease ABC subunit B